MVKHEMTRKEKRKSIEKLLKRNPQRSDRQLAAELYVDHKTVGMVRKDLKSRGEIPHVSNLIDSKNRVQPRYRHRVSVDISGHDRLVIEPDTLYNVPNEVGIELMARQGLKADAIITSIPYNCGLKYDIYKDDKPYWQYIRWLKETFRNCQSILNIGSSVVINVGDGSNGGIPIHSDIIQFMARELDYKMLGTIIWNKNHASNPTGFGTFMSPRCPSFRTRFEYLLVFRYKDKRNIKPDGKATISREEFLKNAFALWNIPPETRMRKLHPAPFPLEIPHRLIQMLTYEEDLVIDIFSGIGTTAVAAKRLNRKYIGFELSPKYHEAAEKRLNDDDIKKAKAA